MVSLHTIHSMVIEHISDRQKMSRIREELLRGDSRMGVRQPRSMRQRCAIVARQLHGFGLTYGTQLYDELVDIDMKDVEHLQRLEKFARHVS